MYQVLGWIHLAESATEADVGELWRGVDELKRMVGSHSWPNLSIEVKTLNGEAFVMLAGLTNHRRDEAVFVGTLLTFVEERFPGSYGLVYEHDDELIEPPGPNAFLVKLMARGRVTQQSDPFLSPINPKIEE